jgi:hypothetical protein
MRSERDRPSIEIVGDIAGEQVVPTASCGKLPVGGVDIPAKLPPQQTAVPSVRNPQLW